MVAPDAVPETVRVLAGVCQGNGAPEAATSSNPTHIAIIDTETEDLWVLHWQYMEKLYPDLVFEASETYPVESGVSYDKVLSIDMIDTVFCVTVEKVVHEVCEYNVQGEDRNVAYERSSAEVLVEVRAARDGSLIESSPTMRVDAPTSCPFIVTPGEGSSLSASGNGVVEEWIDDYGEFSAYRPGFNYRLDGTGIPIEELTSVEAIATQWELTNEHARCVFELIGWVFGETIDAGEVGAGDITAEEAADVLDEEMSGWISYCDESTN